MQHKPRDDDGHDQPQPVKAEDDEGCRGNDDKLNVQAGGIAEISREGHQRGVLRHDDQHGGGDVAEAVHERHGEHDDDKGGIDDDDRPVLGVVDQHLLDARRRAS